MSLSSEVWGRAGDRHARHSMSRNLYALSVTFFTTLGIVFAACMSAVSYHWTFTSKWQVILFALGVLVVGIVGTVIFNVSANPLLSLFGYALVAGPFGLLLGPVVAQYTVASVLRVFVITAAMVIVLGIVGAVIPESLESWGAWLMGGLLVLLFGYFAIPIFGSLGIPMGGALRLWDWVGIALFAALVVFDLNRAMRLTRTLDNSIDSAAAVFLDFINIFIRLLAIMGQSNSSSSSRN
jgi:FtsH-binding integral membrane protein